jgi:hypothetical protein
MADAPKCTIPIAYLNGSAEDANAGRELEEGISEAVQSEEAEAVIWLFPRDSTRYADPEFQRAC